MVVLQPACHCAGTILETLFSLEHGCVATVSSHDVLCLPIGSRLSMVVLQPPGLFSRRLFSGRSRLSMVVLQREWQADDEQ